MQHEETAIRLRLEVDGIAFSKKDRDPVLLLSSQVFLHCGKAFWYASNLGEAIQAISGWSTIPPVNHPKNWGIAMVIAMQLTHIWDHLFNLNY